MSSFGALRVPAYRRLLIAVTLAEIGLFSFETALFWTVLEGTGSAVSISILFTAIIAPILLLTVPVGVLVDRVGPRRPLLWSWCAAAVVMAIAGLLSTGSGLAFEQALALALAEGILFGFFAIPAQVLAGRVVERAQLASAVGLSGLPAAIGAMLGGAAGGLALEAAGPGPTFFLSAAGLGSGALLVVTLPAPPGLATSVGRFGIADLADAGRWIRRSPVGAAIVVLGAVAGFFVMSRSALLPSVARDALDAGPTGLGLLTMAAGVGALVGAIVTNVLGRRFRPGRVLLVYLGLAGAGLAGLGTATVLPVALVLAGAIALTALVYQMTAATILQVLAPPRMRGRVLAMSDVIRLGLVPPGSLLATWAVGEVGVGSVLIAYGLVAAAAVVVAAIVCRPLVAIGSDTAPGDADDADDALAGPTVVGRPTVVGPTAADPAAAAGESAEGQPADT